MFSWTQLQLLLLVVVVLSHAAAPKWHELSMQYTYDDYLRDFDKMQLRKRDYAARKRTFEAELQFVVQHNADPTATFKRNVNKFSDWTREERKRLRMRFGAEHAPQKHAHIIPPTLRPEAPVPTSPTARPGRQAFDWRGVTPPVLTAVKDQGNCGSCWAHGIVEALESRAAIVTGRLHVLSQQQFVSCVPFQPMNVPDSNETTYAGGCLGDSPNVGVAWMMQPPFNGLVKEEWSIPYRDYYFDVPFNGTYLPAPSCEPWMWEGQGTGVRIKNYSWVPSNDGGAFERALIDHGPILVIMAVYDGDFQSYDSGLYSGRACEGKNGTMPPSHIVNLVGFGYDEGAKADYWIIRNSWSPDWGEAGYARLLRPAQEPCGTMWRPTDHYTNLSVWEAAPACGMCGILQYGLLLHA